MKKLYLILIGLFIFSITVYGESEYIDMGSSKYTYTADQPIQIKLANLGSNKNYWVAIFPESKSDYWKNAVSWAEENIKNGLINMENIDKPGRYEARLMYENENGMDIRLDTVTFDINNNHQTKEQIAKLFTNLFERESMDDYGYGKADFIEDSDYRGLTAGIIFTTESSIKDFYSSDAYKVINRYIEISNNDFDIDYDNEDFSELLRRIQNQWISLGNNSNFIKAQDQIFRETTINPANQATQKLNGSPLTMLNLQNAYVLHGNGSDGTDGMILSTNKNDEYYRFESNEEEQQWLKDFIHERYKEFCNDDAHKKALAILGTLETLVNEYNTYRNLGNNIMQRAQKLRSHYEDIYENPDEISSKCEEHGIEMN